MASQVTPCFRIYYSSQNLKLNRIGRGSNGGCRESVGESAAAASAARTTRTRNDRKTYICDTEKLCSQFSEVSVSLNRYYMAKFYIY